MGKIPRNPSPNGIEYTYTSITSSDNYNLAYSLEQGTASLPSGYNVFGDGEDTLSYGLIAYYPLNGTYLANDISGNNNNGVTYGATLTTGINGEANGAYNFDGVNDKIELGKFLNSTNINNFTISLWTKGVINPNEFSYIIHQGISDSIGNSIIWIGPNNAGTIAFSFDGQYVAGMTNINFNSNEWYHLVMTYNGSVVSGYINSVVKNEHSDTSIANVISDTILSIGTSHITSPSRAFEGSISDVRIYNRVLSSSEISLLYAQR